MSRIDPFQAYLCQPVHMQSHDAFGFAVQEDIRTPCLIEWALPLSQPTLEQMMRCTGRSAFSTKPAEPGERCRPIQDLSAQLARWSATYDACDLWYGLAAACHQGAPLTFVAYLSSAEPGPIGTRPFRILLEGAALPTLASWPGMAHWQAAPAPQTSGMAVQIGYAGTPVPCPKPNAAQTLSLWDMGLHVAPSADTHRSSRGTRAIWRVSPEIHTPNVDAPLARLVDRLNAQPDQTGQCITLDGQDDTLLQGVSALRWSVARAALDGCRDLDVQFDPDAWAHLAEPLAAHLPPIKTLASSLGMALTIGPSA